MYLGGRSHSHDHKGRRLQQICHWYIRYLEGKHLVNMTVVPYDRVTVSGAKDYTGDMFTWNVLYGEKAT